MYPLYYSPLSLNSYMQFHSGYVPPEYVRRGIYSMKSDIYSFGVLLLQIISGKRTACLYGSGENLNLLEYVSCFPLSVLYSDSKFFVVENAAN